MSPPVSKTITENRKAKFDYFIIEAMEAGVVLHGDEVKSLRVGKSSISEAHIGEMKGELYIFNSSISKYDKSHQPDYNAYRPRKLLLHKKQINKLLGKVQTKGFTIVPLSLYFNSRNMVKANIALVQGKKSFDKRAVIKEREWNRTKARELHRD